MNILTKIKCHYNYCNKGIKLLNIVYDYMVKFPLTFFRTRDSKYLGKYCWYATENK